MTTRQAAAAALRRLAAHLDDRREPPAGVIERHRRRRPAVVEAGYAQGRADLQLVHGATPEDRYRAAVRLEAAERDGDRLLAAMYADPQHPLRVAADRVRAGWPPPPRGHGASEGDAAL